MAPPPALLERLRTVAGSGSARVGAGLIVLGGCSYGLLTGAGRQLGPTGFASVSALYVLVYTVGPGLFLPLEQELARAVATERATGTPAGASARACLRQAVVLVVIAMAVVGIGWQQITDQLFDGHQLLTLSLLLSLPGYAAAYGFRGIFAGADRFSRYGLQLSLEGATRLVVFGVLILVGAATVGGVGLTIGVLPLVAVTLARPRRDDLRRLPGGEPPPAGALTWLLLGSIASMTLVNAAPLAAKVLSRADQHAEAGRFLAALLVVRIPLFLFAAVQAVLLPALTRHASTGDHAAFRALIRRLCTTFALGTAVLAVGVGLLGPHLLTLFFGKDFAVSGHIMGVLALATGAFAVATVLGQALVAQRLYREAVLGWAAGVLGLVVGLFLSSDVEVRGTAAFALGTAVATLCAAVLVRRSPAGR